MDLDQLRTFDRIARDLSFTKAAARLNITQATASVRIRVLEDGLGVLLFTRGRKVALTDHGMTFLPYARRILANAQEGKEALRRVERGRVVIASLRSMVTTLVSEPLMRFQNQHQGTDVIVYEGQQEHIVAMIHERVARLGIIAWPNLDLLGQDLVPLVIMREPVPLVMAPKLAVQLPPNPGIDDVLQIVPRIISLRWWQVDPEPVTALLRRAKVSAELPAGPGRRLVLDGAGLGLFVRSAIADELARGELVEIELHDFTKQYRDIALVARPDDSLDAELVADFAAEIAMQCQKIGEVLSIKPGLLEPQSARNH